ncbi:MAG: carboxypeptidase regulatory-like domain-containing protein [Saprospiraceae bacterium]|nr:carboxypeptidase regulatory-like domain-containing protein [Saprospiraceae bacterium]
MRKFLLWSIFSMMSLAGVVAQTTIEGKVKDQKDGNPVMFATVALYRGGVLITGTDTDLDGNYFISDVLPGNYDIEVSIIGYATQRQTNIPVKAGRTNRVNFDMSDDAVLLDLGIEIKEFKVPLIEIDNTTQGKTVTAEQIRALPTKNVNAIAATSAGISSRDGGAISVRGSRTNETVYFLDGVRVTGNLIPQSEIEQLQVVIGGIEARYGDVTGGLISLTSKGPSNEFSGGFDIETSEYLDGYGYNLLSGNLAGPILRNKKNQSVLGFRISGQYRNVADNSPSAVGVYRAPETLIRQLEQNPTYRIGDTEFPSLEQVRSSDLGGPLKARPNNQNVDLDLTARIDAKVSENIDFTISGNLNDRVNRFTPSTAWSLLNWTNNPYQYSNVYRGNLRFRHKIGKQGSSADMTEAEKASASNSSIRNLSYTVTIGYQKDKNRTEDFRHKDSLFNYGYYGTTARGWDPVFGFLDPTDSLFAIDPFQHVGYLERIGESRIDDNRNPILGKYNAINGVNVNGLRNNNTNTAWSDLYSNVGQVYNSYNRGENDLYSLNLVTGFDFLPGGSEKGRHNIQLGFLFEQSVRRSWGLAPFGLWDAAERLTNGHINGLDRSVILRDTLVAQPGGGFDMEHIYQTQLNIEPDNKFYRSVREITKASDHDYVNVWSLDPSQLSLDMFSARELIDQNLIDYFGFDYLGNKVGTDVRFEDFFTSKDASNRRSFVVAPFQPIYASVFAQDKFSYKDIIFRLGLRVDYFDANTKVLRDPYALYEIENASDYYRRTGGTQPTSVADDYSVYVASEESESVVAFRKGDQWFLPNGTAVSGGNVIYQGGLVFPSYAGKNNLGEQTRTLDIQREGFDPNTSFVDYKPQINFMPRLAFSFPISDDAGFFAHYDVLYQRPPSNGFASALDYYNWNDISRINPGGGALNNPNLRPVRTVDYEVGFQQKLSNTAAMKISAYYKEMKDLIQQRVFANVAAPLNTYKMFDNLDFGTVKGFSFTLDRRRTNNLELTATYTLQFADGSGSDANSSNGINNRGPIRNLIPLSFDERHRITSVIDYRFERGRRYDGPKIGTFNVLEDMGVNFTTFVVSGQPYTRNQNPQAFGGTGFLGSINEARLPWNVSVDLRIDKRFPVTLNKETNKKMWFNVYFRVQNLFDTRNIVNVYGFSNDAENDGFLNSSFGLDRQRGVELTGRDLQAFLDAYSWRLANPGNFTLPRRMYLGLIMDF